jgi:hypothetical protein
MSKNKKAVAMILIGCVMAWMIWRMTSPMSATELRLYCGGVAFSAFLYAAIATITRRMKK